MSTRTILEINHDYLHALQWDTEFWTNLLGNLRGSHYGAELDEANSQGCAVSIGHGVRLVLQRHHADEVVVSTKWTEVKL